LKVLLIDVDSTIPNLALMKISAYHKARGDEVGFNISDPDKIYASVIFKKNAHAVDGLRFYYPDAEIDIGGSGYDLEKKLPDEINEMVPDYDLYPDCDTYYGFTTRGCIRNCYFCIVRKKEGKFRRLYDTVDEMWDHIIPPGMRKFDKVTFLDNNILADKQWFLQLARDLDYRRYGYKVDFNQGLDIRLVDDEIAEALSKLKPINDWKFAFDDISYKDDVLRGIEILNRHIKVRNTCIFYIYTHGDEQYEDAVARMRILKEHDATPYVMLNMDAPKTPRLRALKRWSRPWLFWTIDIDDYVGGGTLKMMKSRGMIE
jgi:radical SAM superfamily enzyme YgiQ (UPF0313 family)